MKRSFVILPLISALFLTFASCRQNFFTTNGEAWATTYHIAYFSGRSFADSIEAEIAAIDNELSLFNPRSLVSAVNDCATDSVSRRFAEVFDIGQKVWVLSGGVYDPTIGPVATRLQLLPSVPWAWANVALSTAASLRSRRLRASISHRWQRAMASTGLPICLTATASLTI